MTKRFVIATDPLTSDEIKALKDALAPAAWWYWIPNFWLVKDFKDQFTPALIRDEIKKINRDKRCVVMEVNKTSWAALTKPNSNGRQMSAWLKETWDDKQA